jgi:hypothetical protein
MTYASEVAKPARRHFSAVEIDLERCALVFGTAPCGAILGTTGQAKCYNTKATCQDKANYTQTAGAYTNRMTTLRFTDQEVTPYGDLAVQRASLAALSFAPGRLDLGGSTLGQRTGCTFSLYDGTGDDHLLDDYLAERQVNRTNGFILAKMYARWRYFSGREVRCISGFLDEFGRVDETSLLVRTYIVDKVSPPDGSGKITFNTRDPLRSTDKERSKFPYASKCNLDFAVTNVQTTFTVDDTTDLDAAGFFRIGDEIVQYTGKTATTLTGCTRGVGGSVAVAHDANVNLQRTVKFDATDPVEITYQILTEIGVDPAYLDKPGWHTACDDWIELGAITAYISKPSDADKLLAELCEAWLLILYWDAESAAVRLVPARPAVASEIIPLVDDADVLEGRISTSEKTDQRVNEIWFNYGVNSWVKEPIQENLVFLEIAVDVDAQSASEYNDVRTRAILTRWLSDVTVGQVRSTLMRYLLRFRDPPRRYTFSVDASKQLKLGDYITLSAANIQNPDGTRSLRIMRVVECAPMASGAQLAIVAEDDFFQGRYGVFTDDAADDYSGNPLDDAGDGFFCSDYDVMPLDGSAPYLFA